MRALFRRDSATVPRIRSEKAIIVEFQKRRALYMRHLQMAFLPAALIGAAAALFDFWVPGFFDMPAVKAVLGVAVVAGLAGAVYLWRECPRCPSCDEVALNFELIVNRFGAIAGWNPKVCPHCGVKLREH